MQLTNITLMCKLQEVDLNRRGLVLTVIPGTSSLNDVDPAVIVIPCVAGAEHKFKGKTMLWYKLAEALQKFGTGDILTVKTTGVKEQKQDVELYPQQPRENWPKKGTNVITAKQLVIT